MLRALLLASLLLPTAAAAVPLELVLEDAAGDVRAKEGAPLDAPRADILRFSTTVAGARVVQRIELAARPGSPEDSVLVRNWFHSSVNGSFHVVDMEVRGDAVQERDRFRPVLRNGSFYNVTPLADARWGLDGSTWVFEFDAAHLEGASCFDPGVFTEHSPRRAAQAFDEVYLVAERRCRTAPEPITRHGPLVQIGMPQATPEPTTPPPGSQTPTPGMAPLFALALVLLVALMRRRSGRRS